MNYVLNLLMYLNNTLHMSMFRTDGDLRGILCFDTQ
jgi:hypothetical protein